MKTVKTLAEITTLLNNRKQANTKKADTPACVPEKDPAEKGEVSVPHDPENSRAKDNMPESSSNKDDTAVLSPPTPSKTINGQEDCSLNMKIANLVKRIQSMNTKKSAAAESAVAPVIKDSGQGNKVNENVKPENKPAKPAPKGAPKDPPTGPVKEAVAGSGAPGSTTDAVKGDKDPGDKGTVEVKSDPIDSVPKKDAENTDKKADYLDFDPSFHLKIASLILSTDEGRQFAENLLLQSLGQEAATDIVKAAAIMEDQATQAAAYEASGAAYADELWENASEAERTSIVKMAATHEYQKNQFMGEQSELLKQAYDAGAEAAAGAMDGGAADAQADAPAEGAEGAQADAPAEGAEGGDGEASIDDIVQVLQALIQSGQISPDVAEQILSQLSEGSEGGAENAQGGAEGAPAGGEGAPAGGDVPPEIAEAAQKSASVVLALFETPVSK
jgi:hypothetical protein